MSSINQKQEFFGNETLTNIFHLSKNTYSCEIGGVVFEKKCTDTHTQYYWLVNSIGYE